MKNYEIIIHDKNSFDSQKITKTNLYLGLICVISLSMFIGFVFSSFTDHPNIIDRVVYSEKHLIEKYSESFTKERLETLLKKLKVKHIDIVLKQAAIESSHFQSKVFIENNNLFGMRLPQSRVTTAIGSNLNHARYSCWQDSVIDYAIYQSTYLKDKSKLEYLAYLKANYAENPAYIQLINKM